ncbi:MAG: hypothetical protein U5K32_07580 [Bacteroidales bacterium]|nr:hypothetical protein [Bacteroidales bacterium]
MQKRETVKAWKINNQKNAMIKRSALLVLFMVMMAYCCQAMAHKGSLSDTLTLSPDEVTGIFESEEILDISLRFDITEFMRKKSDEEYMDAVVTIYNSSVDSVSYDIKLRARGNSRRKLCSFPPIRLNFKDTRTAYGDIDSMKNIKMVTHCNPANPYEGYILKEYLVYKLYNLVTDYSFRVRLLRVKYIDTGKRGRYYSQYGFLIEPLDLLEQRMDVFEIENIPLRYSDLLPDVLDRMAIFQFMVGNPDWQVASYHNIKIIKNRYQLKGVAVPYDFDYSGFVNTSYALPAEALHIENVRQRVFLGACRPDSTYSRILKEFMDNKDNFYEEIGKCSMLDDKSRRYVNSYLDSFFKLYKRDRIIDMLKMTCLDQ